jgi:hypothetical protein
MKAPRINWTQPLFTAWCLTIMLVAAYGGLRGHNPEGILAALLMLYIAYVDAYLTGEKEKALPRQSYLVKPLPPIR